MTLQALPRPIAWPGFIAPVSQVPATGSGATLDAAGEYDAVVFSADKDMTISHVGWQVSSVAGSPTADVRIETLDGAGNPNGLWAANTNLVTGTLSTGWRVDALTAAASILRGDRFAVKFAYNSGTSLVVRTISGAGSLNLPYRIAFTGGAGSRSSGSLVCMLGDSATTFYPMPGTLPVSSVTTSSFNNTNSAARGNRFQVPFKCRVTGLVLLESTSVGDYNYVLYDDSGAELASSSTSYDGNHSRNAAGAPHFVGFDNPVTLDPNTWYRIAKEPTSATNCFDVTFNAGSAAALTGCPGGANFVYATRASGVWTDDTDSFAGIELLIDQLDDGAGGGGGSSGGMGGNLGRGFGS